MKDKPVPNFLRHALKVAVLALWMVGCEPDRDLTVQITQSVYTFDPQTIRQAIEQGRRDVFQFEWERSWPPQEDQVFTTPTPIPGQVPGSWTQSDFLLVTRSFIQATGKTSFSDSRWYGISFETPCERAEMGPHKLTLNFFKVLPVQPKRYTLGYVSLNIETGQLTLTESTLVEVVAEREQLNQGRPYVPAEAALKIGETVGGKAYREKYGNDCRIRGAMKEGSVGAQNWIVTYYGPKKLEIRVDRETGRGQVIKSP